MKIAKFTNPISQTRNLDSTQENWMSKSTFSDLQYVSDLQDL